MLQNIRERFTGKFALAILALIGVPFLFFGIPADFTSSTYAAKVNGEEVSLAAFENSYRQQLTRLSESGTELPDEFRGRVREGVLNRLIGEVLIDQYLNRAGYRVSDELVMRIIRDEPEFQVDGEFSRERYYTWVTERGQTPASFERLQRNQLRQSQLQRGVAGTAFVTPAEFRRFLNLTSEERTIELATFDVDTIADTIEVDDEAVRNYYEERPDQFRSQESVDFRYVELRRDRLRQQVEITEEELRSYYEDVSDRYLRDAERRARHILIQFGEDEAAAREQATALAERARAGEPFADLARQHSDDGGTAEQGGDLGMQPQSQLEPALANAIFAMNAGEVRGPIRSDFGFHVVKLEEIATGGPLPFEDVRAELEGELRDREAEQLWNAMEDRVSDALFDAESIETMADDLGLETKTATGFTRSGGAGFGGNQELIDTVFSEFVLEDEIVSDIVELDANRSVVVQVTEHHASERLPIEEVREQIVGAIRTRRAEEIVGEKTSELEAAVRGGAAFEEAAQSVDADEIRTMTVTRQDQQADPDVQAAVFDLPKPEGEEPRIGSARTSAGERAVFELRDVTPGRPESIPIAERDQGKQNLAAQAGSADFAALVLELERQADVVRNQDALAQQSRFE